jgi:hypothetical protein
MQVSPKVTILQYHVRFPPTIVAFLIPTAVGLGTPGYSGTGHTAVYTRVFLKNTVRRGVANASKHHNKNVVVGFNHRDYCTEPTLRLDMYPNTSMARCNNNIIAYFSIYMSGFRATGNQIQADTSRYILNVILHAGMTSFFQSFLDSYAGVAQSNHSFHVHLSIIFLKSSFHG